MLAREWWIAGIIGAVMLFTVLMGEPMDQAAQALTGNPAFTRWDPLLKKKATVYRVPWRWLKVIIMNESSNGQAHSVLVGLSDPSNVAGSASGDGKSWGLMQITLATAKGLTGREVSAEELNEPEFNVALSAQLLRELIDRFGFDFEAVMRAYNGGPKAAINKSALTYPYYVKSLANLKIVLAAQPGDELAFS